MASSTIEIKVKTTLFAHLVLWVDKRCSIVPIRFWLVLYLLGCFIKAPGQKWTPILWRPKAKRGLWEIIHTESGPVEVPRGCS